MAQSFFINLDTLEALLDIQEDGKKVEYTMSLEADRSTCLIERKVWELGGKEAIQAQTWLRSLEEVKNDASLNPAVMWLARGLWGIPLHFGPKEEEIEPAVVKP